MRPCPQLSVELRKGPPGHPTLLVLVLIPVCCRLHLLLHIIYLTDYLPLHSYFLLYGRHRLQATLEAC